MSTSAGDGSPIGDAGASVESSRPGGPLTLPEDASPGRRSDRPGRPAEAPLVVAWSRYAAIAVALCILAGLLYTGISTYAALSLSSFKRVPIKELPSDLGLRYEEASFRSRVDGLVLRGWFLPSTPGQAVIVLAHGRANHRSDPEIGMLPLARELVEHGYSVLMFDMRAHGTSEGDRFSVGDLERRDLQGALDYVESRGVPLQQVGVLGFSTGGVVALMVAAERPELRAVVSDSAFAELRTMIEKEWSNETFLPPLFIPGMTLAARLFLGIDVDAASPSSVVARVAPRRLFFIHGLQDSYVPLDHVQRLYSAANNPRNEMWMVQGADHVKAYKTRPQEYVARVLDYFDQELRR